MSPNDIAALVKAAPDVARNAYDDLASGALKEAGKLGEDLAKTIRLILFPVQYAAAIQDRLVRHIDRAVRKVPGPRRITPPESVILPVAEKLRFQEVDNPITELYINLLARAMDGERIGEAHPAFLVIISQLAPDEVVFLNVLSENTYTLVLRIDDEWSNPTSEQVSDALLQCEMTPLLAADARSIMFRYSALNQPDLFNVFSEHLRHLGLITFTNDITNYGKYKGCFKWIKDKPRFHFLRLTDFGIFFHKACISERS